MYCWKQNDNNLHSCARNQIFTCMLVNASVHNNLNVSSLPQTAHPQFVQDRFITHKTGRHFLDLASSNLIGWLLQNFTAVRVHQTS